LRNWISECRYRAAKEPLFTGSERLLADIQDQLNELTVSHFQIYDPNEDKRLWKGESVDTGIRSRYIEEFLIVYKVEKNSAGEIAGILPGDEIVAISGTDQVTPWGAMRRTGEFTIKRDGLEKKVVIEAKSLQVDMSPQLRPLEGGAAVLEINSFRSEFFANDDWRKFTLKLRPYNHLIIDLRDNAGGNFAAMLRALSTFTCKSELVGTIVQPRKRLPTKKFFDDDTSDDHQIKELDRYGNINLRTFETYGCFTGRVTILIDSDTSSVAEIFAHSFLRRKNARVWGQPTAGDVVLAVWYDLPLLGAGYSFSIPEAEFLTPQKEELEGRGVSPQKELQYDLRVSRAGKDSWIEQAIGKCCSP
jgi:carboxyl-terminal processing protease